MRRIMEESKKTAEIEETKRRLADDAARLEEAKQLREVEAREEEAAK